MTRAVIHATLEDAQHYTDAERAAIIASYPPHERDARTRGIPALGSGRVFGTVTEDDIKVDPFPIPPHWAQIGGLDLGWDHPTAAVKLAFHPEIDGVVVTHCHKLAEKPPAVHVATIRHWGRGLQWAWPSDALQHRSDGVVAKDLYEAEGLLMLPDHAHVLTVDHKGNDQRSTAVEPVLWDMLQMMEQDRFKVFSTCKDWFSEFNVYHRKDGKIVKEYDDLMDATRYGVMMRRFARPLGRNASTRVEVPDAWDA